MRFVKNVCPNGCVLPSTKRTLVKRNNHTYAFEKPRYNYCPKCGSMMPHTINTVETFLDLCHIDSRLQHAEQLVYKSEFEAAVREAFVVVETELRKKSGLDLHGQNLVTKALKFEVDKHSGQVVKQPLIAINDLKTESDKNEQDGIRLMLMGFFQGVRNLYLHNHIGSGAATSFTAIINASFFLRLLDGHSITKNGRWLPTRINLNETRQNTPKRVDRIRLQQMIKKSKKQKHHRLR